MIEFPYPPTSGGQLRDYNLLKSMSKDFDLHLLILSSIKEAGNIELGEIQKLCKNIDIVYHKYRHSVLYYLKSLITRIPYKVLQYTYEPFKDEIIKTLSTNNFDLIFCDHLFLTKNLPSSISIPVIPHTEDAFSFLYKQQAEQAKLIRKIYATFQWKVLFNYEIKMYRKYDTFLAISEEERNKISRVLPNINIPIIPNGIDISYFKPLKNSNQKELTLVFVGLMDSFPNEDAATYFVKEIFPIILKENDKIKFFIVGKNPTKKVQNLHNNKNVFVTGTVDDIRPFIAKASIYVVPLRYGTGTRLKILEAMSMAVPVISTSVGCEGLNTENNKNIIIADNPENFASEVINLLDDSNLRKQIALEGRKLAEQFSWNLIGERLNKFIFSLIKN